MENRPIFILGNPRSGTSILRLMLTRHPNIIIPPECHFFLWLESKYKNWRISDGVEEILKDIFNSKKFETWRLNFDELKTEILSSTVNSYSDLVKTVYLFYGKKMGKINILAWGDKNKLWKEKLEVIDTYYPHSIFIHIIRDGRDVACSFKSLAQREIKSKYAPKLPGKIEDIATRWKQNVNYITTFLEKKDSSRWIQIKFEDLVTSPEIELRSTMLFLGLNYNSSMLSNGDDNQFPLDEPPEFMQWKEKLKEPPDNSIIGKYQSELDKFEIEYFENVCFNELKEFGYL